MMKQFSIPLFLVLLYSCANIGTLGGGPVDDKTPKILSTNIQQTNFNPKTISIEFDEFVMLNNPESNIQIFPKHSQLKFSIYQKKLLIKFDTTLHSNTTYVLTIDKGIQDVNNNNPLVYSAIFSTGPSLDSGIIEVKINGFKEFKNLKIAISDEDGSDSFKKFSSDYLFSPSTESVIFKGLVSKPYNIWLFTDENNDNKPDLYKPIAYVKNATIDSIFSMTPKPWMQPFSIYYEQINQNIHKLYYTKAFAYHKTLPEFTGIQSNDYIYFTADSAVCKYTGIINSKRKDSLNIIHYQHEVKNLVQNSIRIVQTKDYYFMSYLLPPCYVNSTNKSPQNKCSQIFKTKKDTLFLRLKNEDRFDTFFLKNIVVEQLSKLSYIKLSVLDTIKTEFDLRIYKDNKELVFLSGVNSFEDYLQPGLYKIELSRFKSSYLFNPFSMDESKSVIYTKTLYLKASWEEILEIKL